MSSEALKVYTPGASPVHSKFHYLRISIWVVCHVIWTRRVETAAATGASALQGRCLRTFRPFLHGRHQFLEFLSLLVCHGMHSGISALRVSLLAACSFVALLLISF